MAEKSIENLALAIKLLGNALPDAGGVRLKLDELLKILERKWYLLYLAGQGGGKN